MKQIQTLLFCFCLTALLFSCTGGTKDNKGTSAPSTITVTPEIKPDVVEPHAAFDTLKDGDFVMRYPNGVIQMKGFYAGGKREGEWVAFFPSGKTQSEGFFTHGKRDHKAVVYYEDGKKMYEGTYKDGEMTGVWKYYNPDGTLSREMNYNEKKESGK
ncbi:MAG TPA: toxin-antitoxin system YwqK family antitoxin [Bacteroidia bacterium]|jgi:hypothetical protein|nr:toxin-antitoxin system YwqK family antitoxin [Bacteroidia bacterium]